jgi:hypothetical protein
MYFHVKAVDVKAYDFRMIVTKDLLYRIKQIYL